MEYPEACGKGKISKNWKRKSDKQPSHMGSAEIKGQQYWVSCWVREGQYGKFFSCEYTEKTGQNVT
jgi:hypothetical protein